MYIVQVVSEELILAACSGDVAKVTSLVKMGAVHVDVADKHGHTALFTAAVSRYLTLPVIYVHNVTIS